MRRRPGRCTRRRRGLPMQLRRALDMGPRQARATARRLPLRAICPRAMRRTAIRPALPRTATCRRRRPTAWRWPPWCARLVWLGGLGSLLAIVFGIIARSQIRKSEGTVQGIRTGPRRHHRRSRRTGGGDPLRDPGGRRGQPLRPDRQLHYQHLQLRELRRQVSQPDRSGDPVVADAGRLDGGGPRIVGNGRRHDGHLGQVVLMSVVARSPLVRWRQ